MLGGRGIGDFKYKEYFNGFKISKIRTVKNDGNSFYRAFMFGLLEQLILNKGIYELKHILGDISNLLDRDFIKNNMPINKIELQIKLISIIKYLESENINNAYETFIKSYFTNDDWDNVSLRLNTSLITIFKIL